MIKEDKLSRNNIENFMSLTSMQQGMLFHYISDEHSSEYHEQLSLIILGDVKVDLLQRSWNFVIENNEMLRTVYRWKGIDKPVQIVIKKHQVLIKYLDFTSELDKNKAVENIKLQDLNNRIDITKETLRIYLCKLNDCKYEMIISNHHILYDGWSNGIILKELMEAYNCLYQSQDLKKINKTKFSEFIKYTKNLNKDKQRDYWVSYLGNSDGKNECFYCKESGTYKEFSYEIASAKTDKIKNFTKENKISLASVLYGAWGVFLQKFSNSDEALFGTTVSGRPENIKSIDNMVGLFINTIPLRVKSEDKCNFINLIREVDIVLSERKDYENTSLVDIKEYCGLRTNEDLFNSIVTIENYPLDLNLNKESILSIENFSIKEKTNYNMVLEILTFENLEFKFNFNSLAIDENMVKKLGNYLERLIDTLLSNPTIKISEVDLLSEEEKNQILFEFNDTKADYPKNKTIQELFEEQVEKTPNNIAVVFEDIQLTYKELNQKSNQLARILRTKGVKADSIVGIMIERSPEMIIGIMAILKAGGAYLPIDPKLPKDRIDYMIKDSQINILVTVKELTNKLEFNGIVLDITDESVFKENSDNLDVINKCNDIAYVIYTSGTTGNPKGVMVEHNNVVRLMFNDKMLFEFNDKDVWTMFHSYCFDFSVWEMYGALLYGGKLIIVPELVTKDFEKYLYLLKREKVTILNQTPTAFYNLMNIEATNKEKDLNLKYIIFGGEALNPQMLKEWKEKYNETKIINMYGITETTVHVTYKEIGNEEIGNGISNIGRPIPTLTTYVMDRNSKIQPIGVPGELCVGGDGVARGYLNRAELTEKKFVTNPYIPNERIYKSGDLVKLLENGDLEYLGRIDNQVKIRGFRIELGEIENRLLQHQLIKEAVVVIKENKEKEKYICAYMVSEKELRELNLKSYLKESLPEYMIPAYFVKLEKMPITPNGKLDRRALPETSLDSTLNEYEAPRNEIEEKLSKVWSEVLGVEKVGINDNFFELGGHSLKATVLISKIHKELDREIPLKELFKGPTIKQLSEFVESTEENSYSKIEKVEEKEYFEASSAQKRMYMLQQFDKDSVAYNMPVVFELQGQVDKKRIEETFRKIVTRHEALRTYFETIEGEIAQKVDNFYEFKLVARKDNAEIETIINKFIKHFELNKAPLFRAELLENKDKVYLLVDMHHIISDGVSMSILIKEFATLYNGEELEPLRIQYKDFASWQNNFLKSEEMKTQEEYWINRFNDEIPVLNLPYDYERPVMQSFEGDNVSFEVDEKTTEDLRKLTKETGTTLHMVLLSAFNILLSRYSGQEDVVVGTPIAGRSNADIQNIMGMFVNTLALRNKPEGNKKYIEFLKEVRENSLKAYENQSYQLETLVEKLDIRRDTSRNPLFDVVFNMVDSVNHGDIELKELLLKQYNMGNKISKFDLTLNALEKSKTLEFNLEYCTKIFDKDTIVRLSKHYINVLRHIIHNNEVKISEVDLLTEKERNQLLYELNDTKADYPKNKTIQELFEEQVEKTPNNIAVVFEDIQLTYKELNQKSNQLARILRTKGVKADSIVGIMIERSPEMIIGIMAILKAGGAYLPIDPKLPKDRIDYMIKDSQINILVTVKELTNKLEFNGIVLDITDESVFKENSDNLDVINKCNDIAYVIYTSGTTGNPKGVMVEHNNVVRLMFNDKMLFEFNDKDVWTMFHSYCFDFSVWEMYGGLLYGGKLIIVPELVTKDFEKYLDLLKREKVTILNQTPSAFYNLMNIEATNKDKGLSLRYIIFGGEALNPQRLYQWKEKYNETKLINMYGITETTVHVTYKEIGSEEIRRGISNIGRPIPTLTTYVMDKNLKLQPIGVPGELCVGGDGVARGYLNRDELTEKRFVINPYISNERIYRSGDLVKLLENGDLEYLGRIDNQVKIRGFRIELGEIQNRLLQHQLIKEAVVVIKENKEKEKYICAYMVSEKELRELNLKSYLKESLPEYMIPAYFVKLEKMPITPNGKLDRRALPEPSLDATLNEYEAPRNEIEEKLSKVWSEVLGVKKVGINDNFFELGGHSLKATVLISKIHKELDREIPLKELFKGPTIKQLSEFVESTEENSYSKIEKVEEKEYFEASSAQKRMYMLQQFNRDSTAYNMPVVFELEGKIKEKKIEETFSKIVTRHEILRTYFETVEDEIVQKVDNSYKFKLLYRKDNEEIKNIIKNFVRPFELEKAPAFRVELIENKDKGYLLIDMHHIISDGVSMSILIKEFESVYNGEELESLRIQYKDFASWQNNFLKSEEIKKQEEYWINRFNDEIPVINLPYDYDRPVVQSFEGDSVSFKLDEETTEGLRKIAKKSGTTMHMVILSAFNILLSKYSGQEDIVVGTPIAGRPHADLQDVMGIFVNTLALRNYPEGNKKYLEFLKEVRENSLKAYENQSYQLEALVEKLDIRRDTSRNPLFDVIFNMVDTVSNEDIELKDLLLKQYNIENKISKFDITLNAVERSKTLEFNLEYCTKIFNKDTINRLSKHYINVLHNIINNDEIKISEIELLSEMEKTQILYEFNDTKTDYPKDKTIQELFEEQVKKTPNNIAVVFEDTQLTYRELNEKANSLARLLRINKIGPGCIVGIMVERSPEMIIGIMAILKAGGAYLPIDTKYPIDRIMYMLQDSKVELLVVDDKSVDKVNFNCEVLNINHNNGIAENNKNLAIVNSVNDLAYVIYTSGSTGKPKGVMIEHKQVNNFIHGIVKETSLKSYQTILCITTICFDIFGLETLVPLTKGLNVVIASEENQINGDELGKIIEKNKVEVMQSTPSRLNVLLEYNGFKRAMANIKLLLVGGEEVQSNILEKLYENNIKIYNVYGPTETTIWSTTKLLNKGEKITIGKPISNTKIFILNNNKLMPIGLPGELCISGDGLARGYLNRPEVTNEKFVENPFESGRKIYRTGDLARWLPDGNIEFLGRIDNQVKIRGFRIELGEIENKILQHKEIETAAVVVKKNSENEKYICAYVVCNKELNDLNLKSYLKKGLPQYMVPAYFIKLDKMPLTPNGKVDRKSLPEPNLDDYFNKYEAPRNELEEKLAQIWSDVLGVDKVGINDNFFELGGHSLKATMLLSKIHKNLNRELPLNELFKSPTIKELNEFIESSEENPYAIIEKVQAREYYESSSSQKRMYMLQQFDKESVAYNMPAVFELEGEIDKVRIEESFKKLVVRHEALRTCFETIEEEIVQKVEDSYQFKLVYRKDNEEIETIIEKFIRTFELEKASLFRVELVESRGKNYLLIDMHHIISDGISMSILIKEFTEIFNGKSLEPLKLQYKDFAAWQNDFLKSEEMKIQEEYWLNRFSDEIPVLDLPYDYERPSIQSFEGNDVSFELDEKTTEELRKFAKETGTTMHMVLLSAFNILLSRYSGQEDIVVGVPVAGRSNADLQNIMGMFVNTLALRNKPEGDKKYLEFLKAVKENSINAYENQSYQLEALIEKLDVRRDTSRNPLFDVMFNMVDIVNDDDIHLDGLILKQYNDENKISKLDLTLNVIESSKILKFSLEYCTKLFNKETIERLSKHYINVLGEILNNNEIKISEIELLSEKERNQILFKFNDTRINYSKDKTIQELFEEQVEKTPNDIAVVFQDKKLTYRELNEKSNQLARVLRDKGIGEESILGIMVERSLEMIIGIMGVLKSGGAYLPIDSKYPNERIEYMLSDSNVKVLLTQKTLQSPIDINTEKVYLDNQNLYTGESENLKYISNANSLAYVMYTSGSTGNPKGVLINHRNVANLCAWVSNTYELHKNKNVLQNTSISFDVSVEEIVPTLVNGGTLYITTEIEAIDREKFREYVNKNNINLVQVVPSTLQAFIVDGEKLNSVNVLVSGGEVLSESLKNKILELGYNLYNTYGPTEATVDITTTKCAENKQVVIGKPVGNMKVYITNKYGKLQPIGVPGELCIGGVGLARGYLNREDLTEQKFIENPFEHNKKIYKSGDLARWTSDGNIEFLGRIDNQVKIKGVRIELEEIENRLVTHERIKEAAVLVKVNENNEKDLCAYLVCEEKVDILEVKDYLKESLPRYMVPRYFVNLERMPLTSNGKINKKVLPEPDEGELTGVEYVAPRNKTEEALVKIWCEVLNEEKIGIDDNFFDLGGHSLKATVLISKIHKELDREIPLKELFKTPTIKGLSNFIQNLTENPYSKIKNVEEKEYYETSSAQKRMYMLQEFDKESVAYNMPVIFEAEGKVDRKRIEENFKKLVERHEALRTYFETVEGEIVQKIDNTYEFKLVDREDNEKIESIVNRFIRPFKMDKAPLFRVELVESSDNTYLLIDMNHIISDGISMSIVIKEFIDLYNGKSLEPLKLQYKDFAAWQNNFLNSEEMKVQEKYWIDNFNDEIPLLNLPYDYERPALQSFEGDNVSFRIDEQTTEGLRKLTKVTETTMHMVLLSAFNILLSKYSGQEDIVVGTPIAGRPHAELQNIMGMFINTLALRNKPKGDKKYIEFLKEVKENALNAYENQSYQLEALVEKLDIRRDTSRNPLFDVMFNMVDAVDENNIELDGILLKEYNNENKISKVDLTLSALENDKTIEFNLEYCTKIFNKQTIERLSKYYLKVLRDITNDTEIKISEIELLTEKERNQILYEFNDTNTDYPKDKTIQELFEEQVEKTPNNIAVVFEDKGLTYKELNEKSNQLAWILRNKGVKADSIVGIMLERSSEMIIGVMAILKAGGAYLPIDPNYPKERIEYMLMDSESKVLLSTQNLVYNIEFDGEIIDLFDEDLSTGDSSNLEIRNSSRNLAYIIYTSGTTGKPKGVMCEHKNVVRLVKNTNYIELKKGDRILQTGSMVFDASTFEVWGALLNGIELYLTKNENIIVPELLEKFVIKNNITILWLTSELFNQIAEENLELFKNLRYLLVGGDVLSPKYINLVREECNGLKIINGYGPTENTTFSTTYLIQKKYSSNIPIGKPIANSKTYIVDENHRLIPVGVYGELCVSGDGLARGYLNRTELTAEKFVKNPFEAEKRMYKTGDLARWLPDGNIEFLGRIDNQIKIRGFRIELGEIENRLLSHENIKEVVVLARQCESTEKYLCAYIVVDGDIKNLELKSHLMKSLPEYMVPSYFVRMDRFPLTTNGKLNRKALPVPDIKELITSKYEAPRNEIQEKLTEIWGEVLGIEKIGINDNFFEIGGHSLKATMVISKIHKELNVVVPLKELFKGSTIKEISKYVENRGENLYVAIDKAEETEYYETSSAQKRLYTLQQLKKGTTAYNIPTVYKLEGKIDKEKIANTFNKLVKRHDSLRTYFEIVDGEIIQKIDNDYEFNMDMKVMNEMGIQDIAKDFVRAFELGKAPLFRVEFIENNDETYLLIDINHIISDGVSMSILIRELMTLYNGEELEPLNIQYKDFAQWQNKFLKSEEMKKQEEYWINRFNDEIPVLNIPYDYERPIIQSFEGDNINFFIDKETTDGLRKIAKESGSTMHMVLLSAFTILLSKYSGQDDIVVGTPIAGRQNADLENTMGMFVNTLALRNRPSGEKIYSEFLKEVKESSLKAYENQSYQFEELLEKLEVIRDTSRNPIFDVMFNMMNIDYDNNLEMNGLILKPIIIEDKTSKFDLNLTAVESKDTLTFNLKYSTKLFKKERIERLQKDFDIILKAVTRNSDIKIADISILDKNEKKSINDSINKIEKFENMEFKF